MTLRVLVVIVYKVLLLAIVGRSRVQKGRGEVVALGLWELGAGVRVLESSS